MNIRRLQERVTLYTEVDDYGEPMPWSAHDVTGKIPYFKYSLRF